ncbi:MAG: hypothetical protein IJ412_03855 [Oscillospiraceae bacterium]|nr:hypothetical protein [Oscillospiraceae bacterium]
MFKKHSTQTILQKHCLSFFFLLIAFCLFLYPQTVFDSLLAGFELAFCRVIPAVFPMMVLSGMLVESPLAAWAGILLFPCTRALGIRDRSAATVFFLGLLGGFAVLAQGIDLLYRSRRIDRKQAELLLCAGINAGPSFILLSVGHQLFGSIQLGALLLFSVLFGNYLSALLLSVINTGTQSHFDAAAVPQSLQEGFPVRGLFTRVMHKSVDSCTVLCGYIAFFCLLCALAHRLFPFFSGILCMFLEVTNGIRFVSSLHNPLRLLLTVAVLSWSGLSIHLQAKSLLPQEIFLRRFYQSRLIAIPGSLALYGIGIRLFPQVVPTIAGTDIRGSRFSWSIVLSFFLMVAAFLYECTPKNTLRSRQNTV